MPTTAVPGSTSYEVITLNQALNYLNKSPTAWNLINNSSNVEIIVNNVGLNMVMTTSREIAWDPSVAHQLRAADGTIGIQSPALALAHELAHKLYGNNEGQATAFEHQVAIELGEPTRADYESLLGYVTVQNATQHTENGQWVASDIFGVEYVICPYNGTVQENTAPATGWGGAVSGGGGGGGGSNGGGGGGGGGGVYLPPYTPEGPPRTGHVEILPGAEAMPFDLFEIELKNVNDVMFNDVQNSVSEDPGLADDVGIPPLILVGVLEVH